MVEGRLSIREDEPVKIVASGIKEFSEDTIGCEEKKQNTNINQIKTLKIDITGLDENKKSRLRGAIKFFTGDKVNVKLEILDNGETKPCGAIFLNDKILEVFQEIVSENNVKLL
jgi:hypothetical protein